jgi:hypothetical protein
MDTTWSTQRIQFQMASSSKPQAHNKTKVVKDRHILESPLPNNVSFTRSWIERVQDVHFINYDIRDLFQFLAMFFSNYAQVVWSEDVQQLVLTQEWAKPLRYDGILSLVDCPHFGHGESITIFVRFFLTHLHGGYL